MVELLLPRTDGGVAAQIGLTFLLLGPLPYLLIRGSHKDATWVTGGFGAIWAVFTAL